MKQKFLVITGNEFGLESLAYAKVYDYVNEAIAEFDKLRNEEIYEYVGAFSLDLIENNITEIRTSYLDDDYMN